LNLPEDQDYGLGPWLHDQNLRQTKGSLDKAKHDLLVEIGYEFADTSLTLIIKLNNLWNKQYQSLVEYKNEYGDTNVPCRWEENPSLAKWVRTQREKIRINKVSEDRLRRLREIDFHLIGGTKGAWEQRFQELANYKEKHGECHIPLRFECSTA